METERVGVLVIRAWTEQGSPGFRARITSRVDVEGDDEVATATTISATCDAVRTWLTEFLAG